MGRNESTGELSGKVWEVIRVRSYYFIIYSISTDADKQFGKSMGRNKGTVELLVNVWEGI